MKTWTLKNLVFGIWLIATVACTPSSSGENSGVAEEGSDSGTKPYSELGKDTDEIISSQPVPVTGTRLTFFVEDDIDPDSVDAYVVGHVEESVLERGEDGSYILSGIPEGEQEIIITGQKEGGEDQEDYNSGIRITRDFPEADNVPEGTVELPYTGSLEGRLEMVGVSGFDTVELEFPGTKIDPTAPEKDGVYTVDNIPVGEHEIALTQESTTQDVTLTSEITSDDTQTLPGSSDLNNLKIFSKPNAPTNIRGNSFSDRINIAWDSGGAGSVKYLVVRTIPATPFTPEDGKSYTEETAVDNGMIVYVGESTSYTDTSASPGLTYTYEVFAINTESLYSKSVSIEKSLIDNPNAYSHYRFVFNSTGSTCSDFATTEVQSLRFYIDGQWMVNDFSKDTMVQINASTYQGNIGNARALVSASSVYNDAYAAYFAFQDNNSAWSADENTFKTKGQFDVVASDSIYLQVQFPDGAQAIRGMEIIGGEPPFYVDCAPDNIYVSGSDDGVNWTVINGSAKSESSEGAGLRYHFETQTVPLTPVDYNLAVNKGSVSHSWTSSLGTEVGFVLVRSTSPKPFNPTNGQSYVKGNDYGDYKIVQAGTSTSLYESGLNDDGTVYYYGLFSYDSSNNYSTPVLDRAVPITKESFRYYRFVVDSVVGSTRTHVERLELQFDGQWATNYNFPSQAGTIDGQAVSTTCSSIREDNPAYSCHFVFSTEDTEFWRSGDFYDATSYMGRHATRGGEYIQLDFGVQGASISGYRALGNDAVICLGLLSQTQFNQIPDIVHMERSADGITWEAIPRSYNSNILFNTTTQEW